MKIISVIFLGFLIVSCATSYQPKGSTGGFSETQLSENTFIVRFAGNAYTDSERSSDFALLRGAELTIQNGYKYFIIAGRGLMPEGAESYAKR